MAILVDVGIAAGAVAAIISCAVLVARLRPVRWVWRTLVAYPLARWFREQVAHEFEPRVAPLHERLSAVENELRPNGGTSFRDRVLGGLAKVEKAVGAELHQEDG